MGSNISPDREHNPRRILFGSFPMYSPFSLSASSIDAAPTSLILQWKKEIIERVVDNKLRIALYYGANRIKDPRSFNNYDIILTSYGTVAGEWPKEPKKKKEKQVFPLPGSDSDSGEDRVLRHMAGPLFRASFYR